MLGEVKAGDKLALSVPYSDKYKIVTIDHVTAKGRIVLKNYPGEFDQDGYLIRSKGRANWGPRERLHVLTDEIKAAIRRDRMIDTLTAVKWQEQPLEVLEAAYAAFRLAREVQEQEQKLENERQS